MELWSEYEGRTIEGVFLLEKLLSPEGRSAYFSTLNRKGVPTLIRLIESHFDEEQILARWHKVTALNHPNLLKMEQHGQVMLDETSVLYAVMEPTDANLGEVLSQQRLILPEVKQLAANLLAAIEALHGQGFIHEHVAADNIFAVGEAVKLRSDCIRETPEGEEGQTLKRRDLKALALVLLQALTQKKTMEAAASDLPLPAPFDQIVRKALSGEWGTAEISAALASADNPSVAPPVPHAAPSQTTSLPLVKTPPTVVEAPQTDPIPLPRKEVPDSADQKAGPLKTGLFAAAGLGMILLLWLGWHSLHRQPDNPTGPAQVNSSPAPTVNSEPSKPTAVSAPPVTTTPKPVQKPAPRHDVEMDRGQWRVIAYKYNLESNAQRKAAAIAQKHPELHPKVFSPTGHTPYLIIVGGAMNRDEAYALVKKAPQKGLPRDTYAQKFGDSKRNLPSGD